ncbi:calcium/sodium antiporter [Cognatilysobacter bugurensis]|uniref:Sodium:calcium antiporter n=1 Tax=Cognatilysobacter bugurensis TaxID=543356 RepID=A0A918T3C2_9GAMM|nr:calcium/sodium antiporter [Lysobacter bugurensis]GHA85987.1 sodium:calcium antiporter [Lysobacter bugurensis]
MLEAMGLFAIGLVLLALGGDSIVKGASGLAQRAGLTPFTAGLVLVAFATSLPELAVNLHAAATGQPWLALGNAVGSNVVNVGLTLGLAALAAPLVIDWRSLNPLWIVLVLATVALGLLGLDGEISRLDGIGLLIAFVAVLAFALSRADRESPEVRAELEAYAATSADLRLNLIRVAIAVALLYFGSRFVVRAAPTIGEALGLTSLLVGLLPVAIGTALPEIAAAVAAARRGQGDLVAGHVIGSSLFNVLVVVGLVAIVDPLPMPRSFVLIELPAALAFALMLYPILRGDLRVSRREGGVLVFAFVLWVGYELALVWR